MDAARLEELKAKYPKAFRTLADGPIDEMRIAAAIEEFEKLDREDLYLIALKSITVSAMVMAIAGGVEDALSEFGIDVKKKSNEA